MKQLPATISPTPNLMDFLLIKALRLGARIMDRTKPGFTHFIKNEIRARNLGHFRPSFLRILIFLLLVQMATCNEEIPSPSSSSAEYEAALESVSKNVGNPTSDGFPAVPSQKIKSVKESAKIDEVPEAQKNECQLLPVWNFDSGNNTHQNGDYSSFSSSGSEISLSQVSDAYRGSGGRSLKISFDKGNSGYCGLWLHLYDDDDHASQKERYLDISGHSYLSFWIKGKEGGENFTIQMADPKWNEREDSKPAGVVSDYLKGPVTKEWQEVIIPFESFGLGNFQASTLVFNFTHKGTGVVHIDDINFKSNAQCNVPFSTLNQSSSPTKRPLARAMWVWHTEPLLLDKDYREEFFEFCQGHGVNEIFLQLPYSFENELTDQVRCVIKHPKELRNFIKLSRVKKILIHALDGYPDFVLKEQHPRVLSQVLALIEFNRNSSPEERYFGIHLDNEPYLLLGFEGKSSETILLQFLDLNQKIMDLLRENRSTMVYGIDIPFWFDEAKDANGKLKYSITYNGVTKNVSHHLIDIVDNIGIMDYRNFAGGADGIIGHGEGEIGYANVVAKKVYVGVETFKEAPLQVSFIYRNLRKPINSTSRFENFKIRIINEKSQKLIGLVRPNNFENPAAFETALIKLHKVYGLDSDLQISEVDELTSIAKSVINNNPGFDGFKPFVIKDDNEQVLARGFNTTEYMLDKITFAGKTKREMEEVLTEVVDTFSDKESFIGFAIHYYQTYKTMAD